jgi:two-component system NtrC family sensor kinase
MSRHSSRPTALMLLVTALLLLTLGGASFMRRASARRPVLGVEWVQSSSGPLALSVEHKRAAWEAGLRQGDLLLEIEGEAVDNVISAVTAGWKTGQGNPVRMLIGRGPDELLISVMPQWLPLSELYFYLSVVGLAFWVSGVFITLRWPNVRGGFLYAILSWCLFSLLLFSHTGRGDPLDWLIHRADLLAGALMPALLVHLTIVISRYAAPRRSWIIGLMYTVSAGLMLSGAWVAPGVMGAEYPFEDPMLAFEVAERAEPLVLAVALLAAFVLLGKSYSRSTSVLHRSQMRWVLWGLGLGLSPSVLLQAVPWALGAPELPGWARLITVAPMLFVPAAFTAALARYRLYDLDLLLLRGLTEVSAIFCTSAVYSASVFLLREGVGELLPISRSISRYLGFLISAIAYIRLRSWVRSGVERAFYRKRYSYRTTLLAWARELNAETDLPSLLSSLRERILATLGVSSAQVLVQTAAGRFEAIGDVHPGEPLVLSRESMTRLEQNPFITAPQQTFQWAKYLFALKVKGKIRAILAIAERRKLEEPLSSEDLSLLGTLAAHAATAIEAARLMQEVRQRAEEVERLHARQAQVLEGSAVGLLMLDGDSRIQAWNRALEEIYDLPREQAIGHLLADVFPLHVTRHIEREEQRAREQARVFRLSMVNRKGRRCVVNLSISPVDGGSDGAAGRVITFDDVTRQVKLEEQVLRQERLASLGLLAAGVAHEINTPLTGISSYTQLLLEECTPHDPRRNLLDKIEAQARRASKITHSMLHLARPENTEFELLDLNALVGEVLQLFMPQIRGANLALNVDLGEGLPQLLGHKAKLQQVLLNLLINSRDAIGDSGTISLETSCENGRIRMEIVDDGVGIADEDLSRVFDPFFTTKGRGKGTGLGLAVTHGIVREHDGQINVECRPGVYTRFRVELPVADVQQKMAGGG